MAQPPIELPPEGQAPVSPPPVVQPPVVQPDWGQAPVSPPPMSPPPAIQPPVLQPPVLQPPVSPQPTIPPLATPPPAVQASQFPPPWGQTPVGQVPVDQPPGDPVWMRDPQGRLGSALVGNEALAGTPAAQTGGDASRQGRGSRWWWGIAAAVTVAVAVAALDAALGVLSGRTLKWYFAILIGWVIGATLRAVGRVSGLGAGLVGAVIALFSWALSAVILQAGLAAKDFHLSFFTTLQDFLGHATTVIDAHLAANGSQYLNIVVMAVGGFIGAYAASKKRKKR